MPLKDKLFHPTNTINEDGQRLEIATLPLLLDALIRCSTILFTLSRLIIQVRPKVEDPLLSQAFEI